MRQLSLYNLKSGAADMPEREKSGQMVSCWGTRHAQPMPNIRNRSIQDSHSRFARKHHYTGL
eukprot:6093520-Prymnesium_polylepis.1